VAGALGQIGRPVAESAAADLARLASTATDPAVRRMALNTLVNIVGPSIAQEPAQRRDIVLRELQRALRTADDRFKAAVAAAIGNLGEHAAPAIGDLARVVEDRKNLPDARRNAAIALSKMPRQIFDLPEDERRDAIHRIGKAIDPAAPAEVRLHAIEAVYHFSLPLLEGVISNLVTIIESDSEPRVRQNAVFAFLYKDGSRNVRGLPEAVSRVLKDPSKSLRYTAARQLAYTQRQEVTDAVIEVLEEMLNDENLRIYRGTNTIVQAGTEGTTGGTTA
jgi:HEAT repeat protein